VSEEDKGIIGAGMLICWGLNIAEVFLGFSFVSFEKDKIPMPAVVLIGGIGLLQLVYILPLYFMFRRKGKTATAIGLVVAACFTALLSSACWFGR
jgi:hypothetical protein